MRKVLKVLKNQKTLVSYYSQLATCYNANHLDHLIELGSDSDDEPKGEEAFNILAPQFQEDPHAEDEEITVASGGATGGGDSVVASTAEEDEGDDDDKDEKGSESEEDEGTASGEPVVVAGVESDYSDD